MRNILQCAGPERDNPVTVPRTSRTLPQDSIAARSRPVIQKQASGAVARG